MKRIVIIDDDPGIQEAFTLIFDQKYYEILIYSNGKTILNGECSIPDIYILDKQLSGVDGLDICRFLRSQPDTSKVPVIMLSASPNIHKLSQLAGADDSLEKPFSMRVLRQMVDRYVNRF